MKKAIRNNLGWVLPILLMALIAPFTPQLDLAASRYFYTSGVGFSTGPIFTFLFNYGPIPAELTAAIAILLLIASFLVPRYQSFRKPALLLILTMAIGAGLLVHAVLKDHWGRPRPKQTIEFGGSQPFRPFYEPNFLHQPEPSKSFSCGHCSMGFYFFALALAGRRMKSHSLFWIGVLLSLTLGFSLSLTRIAQGGHFLSDTLATALVMWLTAYTIDRLLYSKVSKELNTK